MPPVPAALSPGLPPCLLLGGEVTHCQVKTDTSTLQQTHAPLSLRLGARRNPISGPQCPAIPAAPPSQARTPPLTGSRCPLWSPPPVLSAASPRGQSHPALPASAPPPWSPWWAPQRLLGPLWGPPGPSHALLTHLSPALPPKCHSTPRLSGLTAPQIHHSGPCDLPNPLLPRLLGRGEPPPPPPPPREDTRVLEEPLPSALTSVGNPDL